MIALRCRTWPSLSALLRMTTSETSQINVPALAPAAARHCPALRLLSLAAEPLGHQAYNLGSRAGQIGVEILALTALTVLVLT